MVLWAELWVVTLFFKILFKLVVRYVWCCSLQLMGKFHILICYSARLKVIAVRTDTPCCKWLNASLWIELFYFWCLRQVKHNQSRKLPWLFCRECPISCCTRSNCLDRSQTHALYSKWLQQDRYTLTLFLEPIGVLSVVVCQLADVIISLDLHPNVLKVSLTEVLYSR